MESPSEKQKRELISLAEASKPVLQEYFDAYAVLGVRAGDMLSGMHLCIAHSEEEQIAVENLILEVATHIVEKRGVKSG